MPIISELEWRFSSAFAPKNWNLIHEGRTVATLNLKSRLRWDFEGQFGDVPVRAEYRSKEDRTIIIDKSNNEVIGIINGLYLHTSKFTLKDGSVFYLEFRKKVGFVLYDDEGNIIGLTHLNNSKTPISFKFTLYKDDRKLLSPWFVALITFYYALISGSGTFAA
jgi:hypothetical protein